MTDLGAKSCSLSIETRFSKERVETSKEARVIKIRCNALSTFETVCLKTHVGGNKLKEKGKDAFSDGGDRYMHKFTEVGFSGEVDHHAY